jgi:hypothetical protein
MHHSWAYDVINLFRKHMVWCVQSRKRSGERKQIIRTGMLAG